MVFVTSPKPFLAHLGEEFGLSLGRLVFDTLTMVHSVGLMVVNRQPFAGLAMPQSLLAGVPSV